MPLPENTLPMMTGEGPFGSVEMGGMFSILKVRKNQRSADYSDPGWYEHPKGSIAYEYTGPLAEPVRAKSDNKPSDHAHQHAARPRKEIEVQIRKPHDHSGH